MVGQEHDSAATRRQLAETCSSSQSKRRDNGRRGLPETSDSHQEDGGNAHGMNWRKAFFQPFLAFQFPASSWLFSPSVRFFPQSRSCSHKTWYSFLLPSCTFSSAPSSPGSRVRVRKGQEGNSWHYSPLELASALSDRRGEREPSPPPSSAARSASSPDAGPSGISSSEPRSIRAGTGFPGAASPLPAASTPFGDRRDRLLSRPSSRPEEPPSLQQPSHAKHQPTDSVKPRFSPDAENPRRRKSSTIRRPSPSSPSASLSALASPRAPSLAPPAARRPNARSGKLSPSSFPLSPPPSPLPSSAPSPFPPPSLSPSFPSHSPASPSAEVFHVEQRKKRLSSSSGDATSGSMQRQTPPEGSGETEGQERKGRTPAKTEKEDKGHRAGGNAESKADRPTMEECVELLQWLVSENVEVDASLLTVDAHAASLRLLLPHAATQFLPTQVQLRKEDYHPLRSFSPSTTDAESALEPRKKSPFAYVRHPLRLASQAGTSVGPTLPFTWTYSADKDSLSPEQIQVKRWELLRPGDHLRVRIDRVVTPDGREFVAAPAEDELPPESENDSQERRPESDSGEASHEEADGAGVAAARKSGDGEGGRRGSMETPASAPASGGKKGKKKGISLRIAFGWPPPNAKEELENWKKVKAEAERRLGSKDKENLTGERLKDGLEKLISQDIGWALPRLSPLEVTSYLPAHLTSPGLHPHPSELLNSNRNRGPSSLLQEKKTVLQEIRKAQKGEGSDETSPSREDAPDVGVAYTDSAGGSVEPSVRTPQTDRGVKSSGVHKPEKEWIPPLRPPSRQPHRSRIIGVFNNFLLVEVDVKKRKREKREVAERLEAEASRRAEGQIEERQEPSKQAETRDVSGTEAKGEDGMEAGKDTLAALLPIEEFGHILEWVRHREKVYTHRNTFTYGLTMRGNKPWQGFRFAEDEKTGRDDEIESKAPPSSIDLYFSCVQKFPLDLDFPATNSLSAFLPPVRGPPRSPAAGALAKIGTQAVLETANYLFGSRASSSSSVPFLPLPRVPARPPWVVVMSAHPPIPTEVAYMLFFHQPPNHLQAEVEKFHKFMEEREREHLADTLSLYKPYGEDGRIALERWNRAHRQTLRQRQTAGFPWWDERGEAAREGELQNVLGYYQYKMLLLAREQAKEEAALERMHNIVFIDRHGDALEDITHWVLDERKKRLTPKFVAQFVEDIEDRSAVLRRLDLTEPLRALIRERERLRRTDVSALPRLQERKELLTRQHRPTPRSTIENAVDIHPEARQRLLRLLDARIPFMDPIAWMRQIHEEKRRSRTGDPASPPLWEMFMLHARVNLQKAAPPDDIPSYDAWQKTEGAGRRKFKKQNAEGPMKHVVDPLEAMIDQLPEGASDFLHDSTDETVSTQTLRNLQRDLASSLLPRGSRREGMLDDYVSIKDLHPELPELTELAGGKAANQRCEVFLPLTDSLDEAGTQ